MFAEIWYEHRQPGKPTSEWALVEPVPVTALQAGMAVTRLLKTVPAPLNITVRWANDRSAALQTSQMAKVVPERKRK